MNAYFASISRTVEATERIDLGGKNTVEQPILTDAGEPIRYREYVVPPTLWGLCEYLGVPPRVWNSYCDRAKHPEMQDAVQRAGGLLREWKEQALLTRKDVRGLIYHIQNNMGGMELQQGGEGEIQPVLSLGEKRSILLDVLDEADD